MLQRCPGSFKFMTDRFTRLNQTHSSFNKLSVTVKGMSWQVATLHEEDRTIIPPSASFLSDQSSRRQSQPVALRQLLAVRGKCEIHHSYRYADQEHFNDYHHHD